RLQDDVRDCRPARHAGRQRLHRGDHRRDPGRAVLAHLTARLPGPERRPHHLPLGDEGQRRAGIDRRAAGRPPARRQPRRGLQATDAGGTVIDYAKSKGYRYVETANDLDAITSLAKGPVLGLFNTGNMTTEFKPLIAATTPGAGGPTFRCDETNRPANEPSL